MDREFHSEYVYMTCIQFKILTEISWAFLFLAVIL